MLEFLNSDLVRASLTVISSLLISFYAIPIIIEVAKLKNLYDLPNGRTSHEVKTPTLGGIAIFTSFVISLGLFINTRNFPDFQYFLAALTIVFFVGLKDDMLHISALKKLSGQIIAAFIIVVIADIRISNFHGFIGIAELNYYFSVFISMLSIVGLINGFNLIDGIDGLASGIGIVTSLTFGIWFALAGEMEYFIFALALVGSLVAFFRFNVFSKKHKLFMGDTGSLILGLAISVLMIHFIELNIPGTAKASVEAAPVVAIGILIIPLFDTLQVMFIRMLNGKSPFKPDKTHLHHFLLEMGFNHFRSTSIIIAGNISSIILIFSLQSLGINVLAAIFASSFILSAIVLIVVKKRLDSDSMVFFQYGKSNGSKLTNGSSNGANSGEHKKSAEKTTKQEEAYKIIELLENKN